MEDGFMRDWVDYRKNVFPSDLLKLVHSGSAVPIDENKYRITLKSFGIRDVEKFVITYFIETALHASVRTYDGKNFTDFIRKMGFGAFAQDSYVESKHPQEILLTIRPWDEAKLKMLTDAIRAQVKIWL